jgi:hypothetical protein
MAPFKFDVKFKESEEYKTLFQMVKKDEPRMPDFLVDMAIHIYKCNPQIHKEFKKHDRIYKERKEAEAAAACRARDPNQYVINAVTIEPGPANVEGENGPAVAVEEVAA